MVLAVAVAGSIGGAWQSLFTRMCRAATMRDVTEDLVQGPAEAVWARQSVWSQAADGMKARIERVRTIGLGLTIAAAVLTTLATQVASLSSATGKALALAAAVSMGLAPVARGQLASASVAEWTRARAVSEALKSELFIFLTRTGPYRGADRGHQLDIRTGQVLTDADDLLRFTVGLEPAARALPVVCDVDSYLTARLKPQWRWYVEGAGKLNAKLTRVRRLQLALSVVAVMLAAIAATLEFGVAAAWVAVVTTTSAVVTAYAAASRYEYQLMEYLRTAAQLDRLCRGWEGGGRKQAAGDTFVRDCEQVVSVQNEAWMAKWTSSGDTATTDRGWP